MLRRRRFEVVTTPAAVPTSKRWKKQFGSKLPDRPVMIRSADVPLFLSRLNPPRGSNPFVHHLREKTPDESKPTPSSPVEISCAILV